MTTPARADVVTDPTDELLHIDARSDVPRRHHLYDLPSADAVVTVKNCEFRIHSYFFTRESPYFRRLWRVAGSTTETPIDLTNEESITAKDDTAVKPYRATFDDVTTEEFTLLLWVFYNPTFSIYEATTREWTLILRLSQKWELASVEALCWREL
ncbi:hypothetical protein H4582DRAFT_1824213, partial [Lactarius indigo]